MSILLQWVPIYEFPSYDVCEDGRVRNQHGDPIKTFLSPRGTVYVTLSHKKVKYGRSLNALVARAFHGDPPGDKMLPYHRDGDRTNCAASNLEWRRTHHIRQLTSQRLRGGVPINSREVIDARTSTRYRDCLHMSEETGVPEETLLACCYGSLASTTYNGRAYRPRFLEDAHKSW